MEVCGKEAHSGSSPGCPGGSKGIGGGQAGFGGIHGVEITMRKIALEILGAAKELLSAYPDSAPTEQDRKKWKEQAEKRRRTEGIRPRKNS